MLYSSRRTCFACFKDFNPRNGRWNFNKKFVQPTMIDKWAVANFFTRYDVRGLIRDLIRIGNTKGTTKTFLHDVMYGDNKNRSNIITTFCCHWYFFIVFCVCFHNVFVVLLIVG
ncbi:hypothetical protein RYX36_013323 [Vicia faba]